MSGIMGKFKSILKQPEDEGEYEDYYDNRQQEEEPVQQEEQDSAPEESNNSQNNVINFHDTTKVQFVLFKPEAFDDSIRNMAHELMNGNTVILNVEQTNKDVSKRIIDFLGGVAFAKDGKISRVAEDTYIAMPSNVKLSGEDVMDEVESDNIYF
ncbi:MAG: cell division protein SepF [Clostridia bacterium]|nr:cell division protein SepF [Clostridia bacterium]